MQAKVRGEFGELDMSFWQSICTPIDEWMPRISWAVPVEINPQALRTDKKVGVNKCVTAEDEMWGVDAGVGVCGGMNVLRAWQPRGVLLWLCWPRRAHFRTHPGRRGTIRP